MRRRTGATLLAAAVVGGVATRASAGAAASPEERAVVVDKLLTYCRACHGVAPLRFLRSTDVETTWTTLQTETLPGSTTLWKDAIVAALSWPTAAPPPAGSERAAGKEWMPKGEKRLALAGDRVGEEPTRLYLLRLLSLPAPDAPD